MTAKYGVRPVAAFREPEKRTLVETWPLKEASGNYPIALDENTPLTLTFLQRLRPEMRWPNPEALREQIGRDVAKAQRYFTLCRAVASRPRSSAPQRASLVQ